ncbi:MAG: hypothetical protein KCHDKBKB_00909 [Elusimicrobia bacterium]|nr:hypothetical protein [Elusimicrobiota bacterium]
MVPVRWTRQFGLDLIRIHKFLSRKSFRFASQEVAHIYHVAGNLRFFPYMGKQVPEFQRLDYRELLVGEYRVFYRITKERKVLLLTVVSTRQKKKSKK